MGLEEPACPPLNVLSQQNEEPEGGNKCPPECLPPLLRSSQRALQGQEGLFRLPGASSFLPPSDQCRVGGAGPRGSQDGLSDDADEAVGPLSLCSRGSPLGSGPPRRDEGAQVPAAPQVQEARLSPRGRHVGPGSAGLQRGHYLGENKRVGETLGWGPPTCPLYPSMHCLASSHWERK